MNDPENAPTADEIGEIIDEMWEEWE